MYRDDTNLRNSHSGQVFGYSLILVMLVAISSLVYFLLYTNVETPAGYMGYVTEGALVFKSEFVGMQMGPTSTGRAYLRHVINVSMNPVIYTENFIDNEAVQANDSTRIEFSVSIKLRLRPNPELVKQYIEQFTTLQHGDHPQSILEVAYNNFLKQPFRTAARQEIEKQAAFAIKDHMDDIGTSLKNAMLTVAKDTPYEIQAIYFGFVHLPDEVTNKVAESIAANELLQQKDTEIAIEKAEADIRITEAEGLAESMKIIKRKLTPQYLKHEAIKVQEATVGSNNPTVMVIPVGAFGVPLTSSSATTPNLK